MTYEQARAFFVALDQDRAELHALLQLGEAEMTSAQRRRFDQLNDSVWRMNQQIERVARWMLAQWEQETIAA